MEITLFGSNCVYASYIYTDKTSSRTIL